MSNYSKRDVIQSYKGLAQREWRLFLVLFISGVLVISMFTASRSAAFRDIDMIHMQAEPEPHGPIYIYSNADFAQWPGEGTAEMPYIIEGLSINTNMECIIVSGTTVNFVIRDCFLNTSSIGVKLINVSNGWLEDCRVLASQVGVEFQNTTKCRVSGCDITVNERGILLTNSMYCLIHNNRVFRCNYGLVIYTAQLNNITGNTFFRNRTKAINIPTEYAKNNSLFMNAIGWNGKDYVANDDVIDNGIDNAWDNGTVGNEWHENYWGNTYSIPGTGHAIDRHPVHLIDDIAPVFLEIPVDLHILDESSGYFLRWVGYDRFQDSYHIIVDGTIVESSNWTERQILYSINNIRGGSHIVRLLLEDTSGNTIENQVNVRIVELTVDAWIITMASLASGIAVLVLVLLMKSFYRGHSL